MSFEVLAGGGGSRTSSQRKQRSTVFFARLMSEGPIDILVTYAFVLVKEASTPPLMMLRAPPQSHHAQQRDAEGTMLLKLAMCTPAEHEACVEGEPG